MRYTNLALRVSAMAFAAGLIALNIGAASAVAVASSKRLETYSVMKTGTIKALPTAASVRRAVVPTSGQAFAGCSNRRNRLNFQYGHYPGGRKRRPSCCRPGRGFHHSVCSPQVAREPWRWRLRSLRRRSPARKPRSIPRPAATGCFMPPWAGSRPASRRSALGSLTPTGRSISRRRPANGSILAGEGRAQGGSSGDLCGAGL